MCYTDESLSQRRERLPLGIVLAFATSARDPRLLMLEWAGGAFELCAVGTPPRYN